MLEFSINLNPIFFRGRNFLLKNIKKPKMSPFSGEKRGNMTIFLKIISGKGLYPPRNIE
jgi:hypothetical protein